jgi:hypothetical protein
MNGSILCLDARAGDARYILLIGPLLQPEIHENPNWFEPVEVAELLIQGMRLGG